MPSSSQVHGSALRRTALPAFVALVAVAVVASALYQLQRADSAVRLTRSMLGPTPVTVYRDDTLPAADKRPVVVIAHGFAGSQQLMASFALALASSGYLAVSFDYYGHGRNLEPLRGNVTEVDGATGYLLAQTRAVVDFALALPDASGDLALLGHSMASDIVVRYAQQDPRVDATIAVSMFSPEVTASAPDNLLVIVGNLEGFLKLEALRVLGMVTDNPQPGVTVVDGVSGDARRVAFAEGVEHVGVLFSETSLRESVDWLDRVYQRNSVPGPGAARAMDRAPADRALRAGLAPFAMPSRRQQPAQRRLAGLATAAAGCPAAGSGHTAHPLAVSRRFFGRSGWRLPRCSPSPSTAS